MRRFVEDHDPRDPDESWAADLLLAARTGSDWDDAMVRVRRTLTATKMPHPRAKWIPLAAAAALVFMVGIAWAAIARRDARETPTPMGAR